MTPLSRRALLSAAVAAALSVQASAALTARSAHTATLLPDGNILLVGGMDGSGTVLSGAGSVQLENESTGQTSNLSQTGYVAVASATATLLPTGEVLVAGGVSAAGAVVDTAQIFSPVQNCWRPAIAFAATGVDGRVNHTATLLKSGQVLLCGGQANSGLAQASCDLFTPTVPVSETDNCAASGGSFLAGGVSLRVPRELHTATLLKDGRVFLTGGLDNTGTSANPYLVTSEIYSPGAPATVSSRATLDHARAYHRATLLANGKVLIAGGVNNSDLQADRGYQDTSEIYDPVADSMSPGGALPMRVSEQGQVLDPDGSVSLMGGLGNVTTTYADLSATVDQGGSLNGTFSGSLSTDAISSGQINLPVKFSLSAPVTGVIEDGFILFGFSLPSGTHALAFTGGNASLQDGAEAADGTLSGTFVRLNGQKVDCLDGVCGGISATLPLTSLSGSYSFNPVNASVQMQPLASGTAGWTWAGGDATSAPLNAGSTFTGDATISGLPESIIGGQITNATLSITGGSLTLGTGSDALTISLSGGSGVLTLPATVGAADDGSGTITASLTITSAAGEGTVQSSTTTLSSSPKDVTGGLFSNLAGQLKFVSNKITLDNSSDKFNVSVATIVVRKMIFADGVTYDPTKNQWSFTDHLGSSSQMFGQTATLLPTGGIHLLGGRSCSGSTCSALTANGDDGSVLPQLAAFSKLGASMGSPRVNETATPLPDGKVLLAGGSDGTSVLSSSELYDPVARTFSQTGSLHEARDFHTATLLINGRVLVTGGFSTDSVSTGSTNSAELYDPASGAWTETSPLPVAVDHQTATLLPNGDVLVAGGSSNGAPQSAAEIYISTTGTWQPLPDMPVARSQHSATLLQDGRVLLAGGVNATGVLCSAVLYDPNAAGDWVTDRDIGSPGCSPVHSHSATLLKDGSVLLAGGNDGFGEVDHSWRYTPSAGDAQGTWSQAGVLSVKRSKHDALLLPTGSLMLIGGQQGHGALTSVETFDVATSSWIPQGGLSTARLGAAAALTADGQVTIFGGDSGVGVEASAETAYFTEAPDTLSLGVAAGARKPVLSSVDVQPFQGANYTAIPSGNGPFVTIKGSGFLGVGDGSGGGAASGNSSFNGPRLLLQSLGGSGGSGGQAGSAFTLELTTRVYSKGTDAPADPNLWTVADSSISLKLPTGGIIPNPGLGGNMLPYGWYQLRAYSNAVYSDALLVQAGPPKPAAAPGAVSVAAIGVSSISWSWSQASLANGSFDGYEIFSATSGIVIATAATNVVSFAQTNLAPNTTGSILVAAYTLSGDGPLSRSATYYTLCSTPIVSGAQAPAVFSDVAANSLTLSWNAHGNSPGTIYEVSQSRDNFAQDVSTPVPALVNLATTTVTISQLLPATRYYFRVRAVNGAQVASDFSDVVSTTTGAPITGLAGSAVDAATIQWNWVDPGGVTHFNIYNSTTGAVIATTKAATYRDAGLAANSERSIMVSAVTAGGEGPLSAGATAYTLANPPGLLDPALSGISTGSVTAAWSANGNPLGTVYELVIDDAGGAQLSTMTTTGFTAGYGALPQAAADFDVKAAALNGDGVASAFVTLGSTATLAQAPSGLQVTSTTPSSIAVSWDDGNNSSSTTYEVTYSSDNFLTTQTAISFAQKEKDLTSATIPDLLTSSTYSIRVQAVNPFGLLSPFSNLVTTAPFNGGAPLGSLGIEVTHAQPTLISGSIGTGRLITLRIPADTFSTDTHLLVSTRAVAAGSPCGGGLAVGLSITPDPPLQPLKPFLVTFAYTDAELGAVPASQAALERVDDSGACVPLQTTVDAADHLMTARFNHLSVYQLAQVAPSADPGNVVIFPNPFKPSEGNGYVTFKGVPAGSRIRIFTLRGELVFDETANGSGILDWDGTNRSGRAVASGVYLVVIEGNSLKAIRKVVVLR